MKRNKLFGLVLAGGLSKRMGEDKAQITYHRIPQYLHTALLLKKFCDNVFISVRESQNRPAGFPVLPDRFPSEGPLAGILTALSAYPHIAWLTLPVDMPALDEQTLTFLIANRSTQHKITCFMDAIGQPEPFPCIWEPDVIQHLKWYYQQNRRSIREFITLYGANLLHAPNLQAVANINTPQEHAAFLKRKQKS